MREFSDLIHQYIQASTYEELSEAKSEIQQRLQELLYWSSQELLSGFIPPLEARLKNIVVDSDEWHLEIDKWHWMGVTLGRSLRYFKLSEEIYKRLYGVLCDLQTCEGRIAKGNPLYQIGWVDFLRGTPESKRRSQYYMKLAMLEDKITTDTGFRDLPAYKALRDVHDLSETHLDRIAEGVKNYKGRHGEDQCLRPELIYLEYVTDRKNQERSALYDLDPKLARQLMDKVEQADTNQKKGESLEILVAYLFLTSPGFEVLRNLVSFDAQIDLLIRNLHAEDPTLDEFGKYIIAECRNTEDRVTAKAIRDFAAKVVNASCNSGILVTKAGITGDVEKEAARDARMAILKVHQRHEVVIVPLAIDQLKLVIEKQVSLLDMLISQYEKMRFDLTD